MYKSFDTRRVTRRRLILLDKLRLVKGVRGGKHIDTCLALSD